MSNENKKNNLLTEMRNFMRRLHYSIHTENAYCDWVAKYIHFHKMQVFSQPGNKLISLCPEQSFKAKILKGTDIGSN